MIARILAFVRLELAGNWRRPLSNFMFAILALFTIGLVAGNVKISTGSTDVGGAKTAINSGLNLAFVDVAILSVVLPFYAAIACGMPLLVDADRKISRLLLATPLGHGEYAAARFLAATAGLGAVLAAWLAVQMLAFELWPLDPAQSIRVGFSPGNYLLPPILFGLPLVAFTGGVSLWAGVRTRQPVVVFALPLVIFLGGGFFLWNFNPEWLPRWADRLMQAVDPTGFRWFNRTFISEQRGVAFYNTAPLVLDPLFLASRCGFVALGMLGVFAAGRRLRLEERVDRRVGAAAAVLAATAAVPQTEPAAVAARAALPTTTVSPPGLVATARLTLGRETAALLKSPGIWLFGPLILLQVWGVSMFRTGTLDTMLLMTGGAAATEAYGAVSVLLVLLTLFYTVESLYREERCGLDGIARAAPVPTAGWLAGKTLANTTMALVIVGCAAAAILLTLLVQRLRTGIAAPLDLPAVVLILGLLVAPTLVVWTAFVALLVAVARNRFAVYGLALAALVGTGFAGAFGAINWLTNWNLGGDALVWSELDRLGAMWPAVVANRLVMLLLAAVLIALTLVLWPRRRPDLRGIADRLRPAGLWRSARVPLLMALPLLAVGIWTGQQIRAGSGGQPARDAAKAYWRRNSRTWEDVPPPALDRVDAEVKLFPDRRGLAVTGTLVLRNPHREPLAEIPLTVGPHFTSRDWTVDGHPADPTQSNPSPPSVENRSGLYVVRPPQPLATGGTVTVGFTLEGSFPKGWSKQGGGMGEFVLPSGVVLTSFSASFLPIPGFVEGVGVDDKNSREAKTYPLDHWKRRVDPLFGAAWSSDVRLAIEGPEGWVLNGCGVEESRESLGGGRQRVVWKTEHPVRFFNIVGGPLRTAAGRRTTVFYDPRTPHNVPTMVRALDAARDRYGSWFAAYPWTNLRVTEFPGLAGYAQGFPGNISFSETIGYLAAPVDDEQQEADAATLDAAFYIVAHEAGHQWWGNMVTPGKGPGGNAISEGLAEFSACMLLHHELGAAQARVLRRRWEKAYVEGRSPDNERPINRVDGSRGGDSVVTYQRAGWVFWMLRGLMGEEPLLAGLRDFITTWRDGVATDDGLDFPLVEDLLASLRPHAPDAAAFDDFVGCWILGKDLPELVVRDAAVEQAGDGYRVTGELANVGTGRAEVRVRVEGRRPEGKKEAPPQADAVVPISAAAPGRFEIATDFVPQRIVVDPEVELLFTGRKRCETRLSPRRERQDFSGISRRGRRGTQKPGPAALSPQYHPRRWPLFHIEDFFMRHAAARLARRLPLLAALVLLPAVRAADDVVAEEKPPIGFGVAADGTGAAGGPEAAVGEDFRPAPDANNPLAGYLSVLADGPVVLAWKEGRLIVDVPATQAALHGEDFARMRQAVENTLDRAGKLLVEEGVAQGLPRDQAEMLFGGAREKLAADPNDAMGFPLGPRNAQPLFRAVGPAEVAETAFTQALDKAAAQGHVARDGGESSSATGAGRETNHERGQFRLRLRARPGEWSAAATDGSRSLSFAVAAEPRLSLTLGAGGDVADDDGDEEGETVVVRQTAKAFRARIVRAGKEVLKLEAGSFRDCCRTDPEGVRRELAPLLKRIGIRLPPLPDDAAVKAEVVARLRKAAGTDQPGGAQEVAPAALEARKQRAAQLAATIDAFGLLDDRRYLEDLKPTVAAEDVRAIDARLAALAASAGK